MESQAHYLSRAVQAAMAVAQILSIKRVEPVVLHHSQHVSIRFFPSGVVARAVSVKDAGSVEALQRELVVAQYLVEKRAPIVPPTTDLSAGPHFSGEFALTLWQFVEHSAADGNNGKQMAQAANALRLVHQALTDFPGELPSFKVKIDKCRSLLENELALPALKAVDRMFLLKTYHRIIATLDTLPLTLVPIHGDAHLGNALITSSGARWTDFEDTSRGPREWDIGWIPDVDLKGFEPVNREILAVLSDLRSLTVSVWCWEKFEMPEKQEAAHYHLGYLKERFA